MLFSIFLLCLWFWYCPDNCRLFMMYDRGTIFLNALWFSIDFLSTFRSCTSWVTNYSKLWQHLRKKQDIGDMFSWRKKKTFNSVKCMTKEMTHTVYLHRHDMLTVPLTVLLHSPITSIIITITISSNVIGESAAIYFTNHSVQL